MPGYTTHFDIQYPLPGDPIYLGAAQMRALAENVDAALFGAGVPPTTVTEIPSASVIRTSGQNIYTATDTTVSFTSVDWDTEDDAGRLPMKNGSSGLTIRADGIYSVEAFTFFSGNGNGRRNCKITKNGTSNAYLLGVTSMNAVAWDNTPSVSVTAKLTAGDHLYMVVAQDSGATLQMGPGVGAAYPRLTATLLRPL